MSFPYNEFMLDEMQKLLVSRTHLPVFEATHMAHVMLQTCRNVLAGGARRSILGRVDATSALQQVARLRYQQLHRLLHPHGVPRWQPKGRDAEIPRQRTAPRPRPVLAEEHPGRALGNLRCGNIEAGPRPRRCCGLRRRLPARSWRDNPVDQTRWPVGIR
jgi:hypothetical protein